MFQGSSFRAALAVTLVFFVHLRPEIVLVNKSIRSRLSCSWIGHNVYSNDTIIGGWKQLIDYKGRGLGGYFHSIRSSWQVTKKNNFADRSGDWWLLVNLEDLEKIFQIFQHSFWFRKRRKTGGCRRKLVGLQYGMSCGGVVKYDAKWCIVSPARSSGPTEWHWGTRDRLWDSKLVFRKHRFSTIKAFTNGCSVSTFPLRTLLFRNPGKNP